MNTVLKEWSMLKPYKLSPWPFHAIHANASERGFSEEQNYSSVGIRHYRQSVRSPHFERERERARIDKSDRSIQLPTYVVLTA